MRRRTVVVVGAGMAGLTAARLLAGDHDVVVLDKARGVGGRMATRRIGEATFDHGAQFVTAHTPRFAEAVDRWVEAGVVVPWFRGGMGPHGVIDHEGHTRYRGAVSMNAVAKHLAVGLDVRTASRVSALAHEGEAWTVHLEDGAVIAADAVVATPPVPQTLDLLTAGGVELPMAEADALEAVRYDPCLALMAVLQGPSGLPQPGAVDPVDGAIDWMADNHAKGVSAVPAVTIHANAAFSEAHWDDPVEVVAGLLLAEADLAASPVPGAVQVQRWRYARPSVEHPHRFLAVGGGPPLVCAGDAFGGARVEGAALSGAAAAEAVAAALDDG